MLKVAWGQFFNIQHVSFCVLIQMVLGVSKTGYLQVVIKCLRCKLKKSSKNSEPVKLLLFKFNVVALVSRGTQRESFIEQDLKTTTKHD